MLKVLYEYLKELKDSKKIVNINNRLFNFKNTDSCNIYLNQLFELRGHDITVYKLRHTYATMLISRVVDFKTNA